MMQTPPGQEEKADREFREWALQERELRLAAQEVLRLWDDGDLSDHPSGYGKYTTPAFTRLREALRE